jgi:hypothetical protein
MAANLMPNRNERNKTGMMRTTHNNLSEAAKNTILPPRPMLSYVYPEGYPED